MPCIATSLICICNFHLFNYSLATSCLGQGLYTSLHLEKWVLGRTHLGRNFLGLWSRESVGEGTWVLSGNVPLVPWVPYFIG
jgi:hypothetical protein